MSDAALAEQLQAAASLGLRFAAGAQRDRRTTRRRDGFVPKSGAAPGDYVTQPAATLATAPVATGAGMR